MVIEAIYENGILRPLAPLPLPLADRARVTLSLVEESEDWLDADYARLHYSAPPDSSVTHVEVRAALAKIPGSMDAAIDDLRGSW